MRAFVITLMKNEKSVEAAERCIGSASKVGLNVEKFDAFAPENKPFEILRNNRVITEGIIEKYSRSENCAAAFLSHFTLWKKCLELNAPIIIFEHDAFVVDPIAPSLLEGYGFKQMISIGKPSYGQWRPPQFLGTGPLTSKKYFPGAHAYIVKPAGARTVIEYAQTTGARPTDVYLNKDAFPFWLDCIVSFKTISGATCQIESATIPGSTAEIKPAPLDMAPFNAKYAAPGYFSLPAISNVLPL